MSTTAVVIKADGTMIIEETGHGADPGMTKCLTATMDLLNLLVTLGIKATIVESPVRAGEVAETQEEVQYGSASQRQA